MSDITLTLSENEVQWLAGQEAAAAGSGSAGAKARAAVPAPIVWETHLGVEMARVGDRVALLVISEEVGPDRIAMWSRKSSQDEAEAWLRGGAK